MRNFLRNFMAGRNGFDQLCLAQAVGAILLNLLARLTDRDVLSLDEVGMHPLKNNASIAMKTDDLLHKYFLRTGHEPQILDIPEEVEA